MMPRVFLPIHDLTSISRIKACHPDLLICLIHSSHRPSTPSPTPLVSVTSMEYIRAPPRQHASDTPRFHATSDRDSQHDNETYYSNASDSDSSGAERRSVKSSSSSRVGKYTPPHRKSGSASPTKDLSVRPPPADSGSPVDPAVAADLAAPVVSSSDVFPSAQSSSSPSSASSSSTPAPSSPATSATSSTVTSKQCEWRSHHISFPFRSSHSLFRFAQPTSNATSTFARATVPKEHYAHSKHL